MENKRPLFKIVDPEVARRQWERRCMRDRFTTVLVKRLRSGQFISPAMFHRYTIPTSHHCFRKYVFRIHPFDWYLRKHRVAQQAAPLVKRLARVCPTLSRLFSQVKCFKNENTLFLKTNPILRRRLQRLTPFQAAACAKLYPLAFPEKQSQSKPNPTQAPVNLITFISNIMKSLGRNAP